ncbi:MAG: hypothetical protein ACK53C_17505, partial [Pseudomonadota bacterium]
MHRRPHRRFRIGRRPLAWARGPQQRSDGRLVVFVSALVTHDCNPRASSQRPQQVARLGAEH